TGCLDNLVADLVIVVPEFLFELGCRNAGRDRRHGPSLQGAFRTRRPERAPMDGVVATRDPPGTASYQEATSAPAPAGPNFPRPIPRHSSHPTLDPRHSGPIPTSRVPTHAAHPASHRRVP